MLIPEHPLPWFATAGAFFGLASGALWSLAALGIATGDIMSAPDAGPRHRRSARWLATTAFLLLAVSAFGCALLDATTRHSFAPAASGIVREAAPSGALALLMLSTVVRESAGPQRKRFLVLAPWLLVPAVQAGLWPGSPPVTAAALLVFAGILALAPGDGESPAQSRTTRQARTLFAAVALTFAISAVVTLVLRGSLLAAAVVTLGAAAAWLIVWRAHIAPAEFEKTRHPARDHRVPWFVPPLTPLFVFVLGSVAAHIVRRAATDFVATRVHDQIVAAAHPVRAAAQENDTDLTSPDATVSNALATLTGRFPEIQAAAIWRPRHEEADTDATFQLVARQDWEPLAQDRLVPQNPAERAAVGAGESFLRWPDPQLNERATVVAMPLPAASPDDGAYLAVAFHADWADRFLAWSRLLAVLGVPLTVIATGIAAALVTRLARRAQRELGYQRATIESEARNELIAMVSHEVRTPLQSVLGYAELAALDALPPAAERHVRAIRGQSAALLRMVQDILDFNTLRSRAPEFLPEPASLQALVADVRYAMAERARRKGLALTFSIADDVPSVVRVDRGRLLQVLLNLVGNAVKFTAAGKVSLEVLRLDLPPNNATARLRFQVADTGPGIPAQHRSRIFEPFRKAHDDGATGGIGLGLAICEQIVRHLGGSITVQSQEGRGTTFAVELDLPIAPGALVDAAADDPLAAELSAMTLAGLKILIVDDHPMVRDLLHDSLRRLGAVVTACGDGASALAAFEREHPDVVLLDLKLPDHTPETMLAGLRGADISASEPWIIGFSAGATEPQVQHALERGMNDFLLKPVSIPGLVETLRLSPVGAKIQPRDPDRPETVFNPRAPTADEQATLLAEAVPAIVRIAHACHIGDVDSAAREAHFLGNSCTLLGLREAHRICLRIETAAEQADLVTAREALAELRTEIARAHAARDG